MVTDEQKDKVIDDLFEEEIRKAWNLLTEIHDLFPEFWIGNTRQEKMAKAKKWARVLRPYLDWVIPGLDLYCQTEQDGVKKKMPTVQDIRQYAKVARDNHEQSQRAELMKNVDINSLEQFIPPEELTEAEKRKNEEYQRPLLQKLEADWNQDEMVKLYRLQKGKGAHFPDRDPISEK